MLAHLRSMVGIRTDWFRPCLIVWIDPTCTSVEQVDQWTHVAASQERAWEVRMINYVPTVWPCAWHYAQADAEMREPSPPLVLALNKPTAEDVRRLRKLTRSRRHGTGLASLRVAWDGGYHCVRAVQDTLSAVSADREGRSISISLDGWPEIGLEQLAGTMHHTGNVIDSLTLVRCVTVDGSSFHNVCGYLRLNELHVLGGSVPPIVSYAGFFCENLRLAHLTGHMFDAWMSAISSAAVSSGRTIPQLLDLRETLTTVSPLPINGKNLLVTLQHISPLLRIIDQPSPGGQRAICHYRSGNTETQEQPVTPLAWMKNTHSSRS